jgi:hypothetical protein
MKKKREREREKQNEKKKKFFLNLNSIHCMRSNIIGKFIHIFFFLSLFKFQYRLNTQKFYKIFFIFNSHDY